MSLPPNANYYKLIRHKQVGADLRNFRVGKDLSGKDAAELVGLSQPQLSRIENGHQAFFTDKVKNALTDLMHQLGMSPATWAEADWREGKRKSKKVTTPSRTVAASAAVATSTAPVDVQASADTLLRLYDAGLLNRDAMVNAMTTLMSMES